MWEFCYGCGMETVDLDRTALMLGELVLKRVEVTSCKPDTGVSYSE